MEFTALTDHELYRLCKQYGTNARLWMRKFAGLLPEVYRRRLYKRRGYASIHEFAAKLAGMSERTVDKILNLAEKLKDKPVLNNQFESGSVGWGKLQTVAYIATPETEKDWAEKIEKLSARSLEEYVKEYRKSDGSNDRLDATHVGHGQNNQPFIQEVDREFRNFSFSIAPEVEQKLRLLKQEIEKEKRTTMSWNNVITQFIKAFEENEELKMALAGKTIIKKVVKTELCPNCLKQKADEKEQSGEVKRAIPAAIEKFIRTRSGGKCEFPMCIRPGEIFHHTRRYALRKNHDPQYIVFLCKPHEGLLQAGYIENEERPPSFWRLRKEPDQDDLKILIDEKVTAYRGDPISRAALLKQPVFLHQFSDP